jgi:dTDP-4-amino-4,6-dideoxygalactose transaminase
MDPILAFARKHGLRVIEDACQAHGARWNGRSVGSFGDAGCFSFYPGKNLGAYGDAGAVVTNDVTICEGVRLLRDLGQRRKYEHLVRAGNCRLDHAESYDAKLSQIGITPPSRLRDEGHVYHLYVIEVEDRSAVRDVLAQRGVATGVHYPVPIHLQPAYADLGLGRGSFPRTERSADRILSLPMFAELTERQIDLVVDGIEAAAHLVRA